MLGDITVRELVDHLGKGGGERVIQGTGQVEVTREGAAEALPVAQQHVQVGQKHHEDRIRKPARKQHFHQREGLLQERVRTNQGDTEKQIVVQQGLVPGPHFRLHAPAQSAAHLVVAGIQQLVHRQELHQLLDLLIGRNQGSLFGDLVDKGGGLPVRRPSR